MNTLFNKIVKDKVYYQLRCDDKKKPPTIQSDQWFKLSEINELNTALDICNRLHLNYDLAIEEWIEKEQSIGSSIDLVNNNYKNI